MKKFIFYKLNNREIRKIDEYIANAESLANKKVNPGKFKTNEEYADEWNYHYHTFMDELTFKAGLRRTSRIKN